MLTTPTMPVFDTPAGKAGGPGRYPPQAEPTPSPDRFATLLQQRQNAQAPARTPAGPKESPAAPKAAAPRDRERPESADANPTTANGGAPADAGAPQASTGCGAAGRSAPDGQPTLAPPFGREVPIADAPPSITTDTTTDAAAAAGDAPGHCELPIDIGKRGTGDGNCDDDGNDPAAMPEAPVAAVPFWPGTPSAPGATPAAPTTDALAAAGGASDPRTVGKGATTTLAGAAPEAGPAAGGDAAQGSATGTADRGANDARHNDARDDRAAALLAAVDARQAAKTAHAETGDKTLASPPGERFTLPARATPPLHAAPGWLAPAGATTGATAFGAAPSLALPTPLHAPDFAKALGAQVSMFARNGLAQAELQLTPAEMGPIRVHIAIDGAQARVDFSADAAATRQVIERGLPELASALREQGLTLAGGGVFQRAPDQRGEGDAQTPRVTRAARSQGRPVDEAGAAAGFVPAARARAAAAQRGGVDLYA